MGNVLKIVLLEAYYYLLAVKSRILTKQHAAIYSNNSQDMASLVTAGSDINWCSNVNFSTEILVVHTHQLPLTSTYNPRDALLDIGV